MGGQQRFRQLVRHLAATRHVMLAQVRRAGVLVACLILAAGNVAASATTTVAAAPGWQQLTPEQQTILQPVQSRWPHMSDVQRNRLLAVAAKYPGLSPQAQQRFRKRLTVWSALTRQQRDLARRNYLRLKKLPPAKRRVVKQELLKAHPPLSVPQTGVGVTAPSSTIPVQTPPLRSGSSDR